MAEELLGTALTGWIFIVVFAKPVKVIQNIVLERGIEFVKIPDDTFKTGVFACVKDASRSCLEPHFIYAIGQAYHFDKAVVYFSMVFFYSSLK